MTEKLFYQDSHLGEFEAEVISCEPFSDASGKKTPKLWAAELGRTAFFPEGGGQYADTGMLGGVRVVDVQEKGEHVLHLLEGPLEPGSHVTGTIDWEERFMKMQQHSGEHIVSGLVHSWFGYNNVGFHLGSEDCTMDLTGSCRKSSLPGSNVRRTVLSGRTLRYRLSTRRRMNLTGWSTGARLRSKDRCGSL